MIHQYKKKVNIGSSLVLPAHGKGGARVTIEFITPLPEKFCPFVQQAGKNWGSLRGKIFARLLSAEGGMGRESVSAIPASAPKQNEFATGQAGRQNRKIFISLIEKIFARGRLKNVKKIFLFCSPSGERKRWAGQSAKSSGFCSKKVLTSSNKHHQIIEE